MTTPRVLLIHPGQTFSTADVYTGVKSGLEANGVEVVEYRLDAMRALINTLTRAAVDLGVMPDEVIGPGKVDPLLLSSSEAIAAVVAYEPHAVLAISGVLFEPHRAWLMQKFGIPVACLGTESPYQTDQEQFFARAYTHWFTNERTSVKDFAPITAASYVAHAYDPAVHYPGAADADKQCDVVFVGTGFPERKALFDGVNWTGIDFRCVGTLWDIERPDARDERLLSQGSVPNAETAAYYRSAKIVINHHRTSTYYGTGQHIASGSAESIGPRAYEIAACKAFQLCDDSRPELFELFGDAAATYHAGDSADLARQIRYWLDHPDERQAVAAAQHAAVQAHSWHERARQILQTLFP